MASTPSEEGESSKPWILSTVYEDGSADFTVALDEDDHKFSVTPDGHLQYEETLTWPGVIRVSEPPEGVWKLLMQSREMTDYLNEQDIKHLTRQ